MKKLHKILGLCFAPFFLLTAVAVPLCLQAGEPAAKSEKDSDAEATLQTTKFIQPLKKHKADIGKIHAEIDKLLKARDTTEDELQYADDIEKVGRKFLKEGNAFRRKIRSFLAGETRRGLIIEIDLIRDGVMECHEMLVKYRRLVGVDVVPLKNEQQTDFRNELLKFFEQKLRQRVTARLHSQGLKDIVDSKTWREAHKKAIAHIRQKVNTKVDAEMTRLAGMAFHDKRSLQRALRQRINRAIEKQIARLIVKKTSNALVIEIAGAILSELVKDKLWNSLIPRIKEMFREKGKHESRVARSIATMEAARMRLHKLPKDTKITNVVREVNRATQTVMAARYLLHDLAKAEDEKKLADMKEAIGNLLTTASFTSNVRFMLDRESLVMRLAVDEEVLKDTLDELRQLLGGVEEPEEQTSRQYFMFPYELPDAEGTVVNPQPKPYFVSRIGAFTALYYIDRDQLQKDYDRLKEQGDEDAFLDIPEFVKKRFYRKPYKNDYILRITCNGVTRYSHQVHRPGNDAWYGGVTFFGLSSGKQKLAFAIETRDGFRLDRSFTVNVRVEGFKNYDAIVKRMARNEKILKDMKAKFGELSGTERGRHADKYLRRLQPGYLPDLMKHGRGTPAMLTEYLKQMPEAAEFLLEIEGHPTGSPTYWTDQYITWLRFTVHWYRDIGNGNAYGAAKALAAKATGKGGQAGKSGKRSIAAIHRSLADLAISSGNDVESARSHLEQWLVWRKKAGDKIDKKRERLRWPEQWDTEEQKEEETEGTEEVDPEDAEGLDK